VHNLEKNRLEINYWRDTPGEAPGPLGVPNILNKMLDATRLFAFFQRFERLFAGRILELGAGQGWASCLIKRLVPAAHVVATDISPYAIASVPEWERLWGVKLDGAYACLSASTREADASQDLVFCFGAAHHFTDMAGTLREIHRILKPGGTALFLYEPSSPAYIHPLAKWRVNRVRPAVPEDLLIRRDLMTLGYLARLEVSVENCFSTIGRSLPAALYYRALSIVPPLTHVLPCAMHAVLKKA